MDLVLVVLVEDEIVLLQAVRSPEYVDQIERLRHLGLRRALRLPAAALAHTVAGESSALAWSVRIVTTGFRPVFPVFPVT